MATTIVTKSGSGAPTASDLVAGELAVDLTNKRLYTEDSGGTVLELGTNPASDVTFGDNTKAVFGTGSDLQIYHDASHSYIVDAGTGNMYLSTNGNGIVMQASLSETMFAALPNGAVTLYHDNAAKIATTATGIDVTGTVTADGLTVDGDSISFNTTAGGLDINPLGGGSVEIESSGTLGVKVGGTSGFLVTDASDNNIFKAALNGDISFYEDTGTTPKFFWDASAEALGIGTTSPSSYPVAQELVVDTGVSGGITVVSDSTTGGYGGVFFADGTTGNEQYRGFIQYNHNNGGSVDSLILGTSGTERMRIDASGDVGIGTTGSIAFSAGSGLRIERAATATLRLQDTGAHGFEIRATASAAEFFSANSKPFTFSSATSELMRIDASGQVQIGGTAIINSQTSALLSVRHAGPSIEFGHNNQAGYASTIGANSSNGHPYVAFSAEPATTSINAFRTRGLKGTVLSGTATGDMTFSRVPLADADNQVPEESMRIDASGNLLVGTTSATGSGASSGKQVIQFNGAAENGIYFDDTRTASGTSVAAIFGRGSTAVGRLDTTLNSVALTSLSDERVKNNIVDAPSASDDIDAIQVRSFDWKSDGSHQKYGMVAQELLEVAPEAVSAPEDPEEMMGVDYSKLVPMMLKEIQSLRARVAQLES